MRYHPKSNKGVFSKKQRQASRYLMHRFKPSRDSSGNHDLLKAGEGHGFLAGIAAMLFAGKGKRR